MSSGIYYIDALLTPAQFRWGSSTVTYGFMSFAPGYANPFDYPSFAPLNSVQMDAVHRAVQAFESVCNIDLQFVGNGNAAAIRFGTAALDPAEAAHAYYPSPYYEQAGDVWFNNIPGADAYQQWAGSYGYMVTLHEMAHAVGLKHSFESAIGAPTVLPFGEDNRRYTVMSYSGHPTASVEPSTLLLYDIAALQYLYGANMSTRTGNDIYSWGTNAQFVSCIWDAGGIDTISAANQIYNVTINLRPGGFSSIGAYSGGAARNNLSIAYGATIENATGGSGNDRLIGNAASNRLDGGPGTDTAVFAGNRAGYQLAKENGQLVVSSLSEGTDILINIEYLEFADQTTTVNWAPIASAANYTPAHGMLSVAANSLFSVVDPDGDDITHFRVYDGTAGNGYFVLNGSQLAALQNHTLAAADLPNLRFVTSTTGSGDVLWVQAFDGYAWGAWKTFSLNAMVNGAAVVNVANLVPSKATSFIAGADLFDIADPDGDPIVRYRFYDGTLGNGRFYLNGMAQLERQNFEVDAADLADFEYRTSTAGGDTLWVQAYDGYAWSDWRYFTVAAPANVAPVVNTQNLTPAKGTTFIAGADLFTITDPDDANTAVEYKVYDGTIGNGYFTLSGSPLAERTNHTVTQAQLADLRYIPGSTAGDTLWIQAFDGTTWGAWVSFTVAAPANVAPVVNVQNLVPAHGVTAIAGANLFTLTDPDDANTAVAYRFYDGTLGNGRFYLNGVAQIEQRNIGIPHADLADFEYRIGTTGVGDTLWIQAFDGTAWSAWKSFTVAAPVNAAPVVNVQNLAPAHGVTSIAGDHLYTSITDADGDPITRYRFYDGTAGNGRYYLNGVAQVERQNIEITQAQLANFEYRTSASGSDVLWVQAFDGTSWSAWKSFTAAAIPNAAPVVTVQNLVPTAGQTAIVGTALYTAITDADGDPMTRYRFYDGTLGNGRFYLDGMAQVERANIEIDAADLPNFEYRTRTGGGDTLWVQAYDGHAWSDWKSYTVAARPTAMTSQSVDVMASQITAAAALTGNTGGTGLLAAHALDGTTKSISDNLRLILAQT